MLIIEMITDPFTYFDKSVLSCSVCRFLGPAADEACQYVTGIVGKNPLLLRELNLSEHELGDSNVNRISTLLQDKHCKLNTLM